MALRKQITDQAAHGAVALGVLSLAATGEPLGFALAGFLIGMVREVTEAGLPVTWSKIKAAPVHSDAPLDLTFWTLGGLLAGLVGA